MLDRNINILRQRRQEDELRLKALRLRIKAGLDAIDRGDSVEVEEADIDEYLEKLTSADDQDSSR